LNGRDFLEQLKEEDQDEFEERYFVDDTGTAGQQYSN